METHKTFFQFRSKTYVIAVDKNAVSVSEKSSSNPLIRFKTKAKELSGSIEIAKRKMERLMLKTPNPEMRFSD